MGLGQVGLLGLAGAMWPVVIPCNFGDLEAPNNVWKGMKTLHTIPKKRLCAITWPFLWHTWLF